MSKEIKLTIDDATYDKIDNYIKWINMEDHLENNESKNTIDDFIIGSVKYYLEELAYFSRFKNPDLKMKNRLKVVAKERGIKQSDVCRETGIKKANISLIFNNKHQPSSEVFFRIWIALKCPPINKCIYFD